MEVAFACGTIAAEGEADLVFLMEFMGQSYSVSYR
jgi:hypothetical protein